MFGFEGDYIFYLNNNELRKTLPVIIEILILINLKNNILKGKFFAHNQY